MPELKAGDAFPAGVAFAHMPALPAGTKSSSAAGAVTACAGTPRPYDASAEFKNGRAVLVAVPGAFTPTCQAAHLPSFIARREALRARGVERVVVVASNDAYVMAAWARANDVADDDFFVFASDEGAKFSASIGWALGERTARYAIAVDRGAVLYAGRDEPGEVDRSGADAVLAKL